MIIINTDAIFSGCLQGVSEVHGGRSRQHEILIDGIHGWIIRLTTKDTKHIKNHTFILLCPKDITKIVIAAEQHVKFDQNEHNKIFLLLKNAVTMYFYFK